MQALLSSRLRLPTDVTFGSVEQATFGEFIMSLGNPCAAFVFDLGGGAEFQGVLDLEYRPVLPAHRPHVRRARAVPAT